MCIRDRYETTLAELGTTQDELESQKAELEAQIEEAVALIADLDEDIEQAQQEYLANEAAEQSLNAQMNEIAQKMWEAEQAAKDEQQGGSTGGDSNSGDTGSDSGSGTVTPPDTSVVTGTYVWP